MRSYKCNLYRANLSVFYLERAAVIGAIEEGSDVSNATKTTSLVQTYLFINDVIND